ncbi:hypothetical protein NBRC10512_000642 [Rhodotorula toruloides]|uniref:RHTO0S08e00496g1_1 n=2 Tax=Rhodotorula toruloides TaxID=5286 RepID=A0A061B8Y1_RHOTO|nr:ubiquinone biosynthesis, ABC1 family protein [Rhodotorula toruloides NP11]EMS20365.1 ubiquinone biosynthesis, ABC1 family protein [Rhodotorula toruloides NP11]CDR43355.1 RHTO0S08e00496g1_1 [Rhodotorula toruloides]
MLQTRGLHALRPPPLLARSLRPQALTRPRSLPASAPSIRPSRPAHSLARSPAGQSQGSGWSYHSHARFAFIPVLFGVGGSGALLLDTSHPHDEPKHSLKSILDNVEKPEADEFLIAVNAADIDEDEANASLVRRIRRWVRDWVLEPVSTSLRFLQLVLLFLPVLVTAPILALELVDERRDRRRGRERRTKERTTTRLWYLLLVHQMEMAGPTFIKLAQWAGSRTDLFPAELCTLFGKLHSQGSPHSFRYTKRVIERAFGLPFSQIFVDFRRDPLGIGAIAQVYKAVLNPDLLPEDYLALKHTEDPAPTARLRQTIAPTPDDKRPPRTPGATVAIKVLHPGVEKKIRRDLKLMMFFAKALNALPGMEWLSFPEEVQVFGEMMLSQVDLRIEANNLVTFEKYFMHRPTVSFPRALKQYTAPRVLIEEFEDAVPLELFLNNGGGPFDHRIANLGLDAFLNMMLIDNFVHSDLHPGNIMVKWFKPSTRSMLASLWATWRDKPEPDAADAVDNVNGAEIVHRLRSLKHDKAAWLAELDRLDAEGYQPELVFIDTGLVTRLNETNRRNFIDLFTAIASFDGYRAGQLMVERCRAPELVVDEETFALKMQKLVLGVKSQTFSLGKIKISDVLSQVLTNVREHHVKMEADFVNTVISILLLEGIGRQLDPEMDLFKSALPILRQLGQQVGREQVMSQASKMDVESLASMAKIWVWIEARQLASIAVADVDDFLRYDTLMPNV